MKGIVYDTITKKVKYKFDTPTLPKLQANEAIVLRDDIEDIHASADYNPITNTYMNSPGMI